MNKLSEFLLLMMGISADEEEKQRREHDRWEKQRKIAEKETKRRKNQHGPSPDKRSKTSDSS